VGASGINGSVAALRFFFTVTLDRPEMARHLTFVREPRKIPVILSLEEIARLLEAAPGPKYKAALSAAYGAGLRVSEVVALKVSDIDSERMLLHIEQGKGPKDRFAMLSPRLLELLRDWYRIARPTLWLFPGRDPLQARIEPYRCAPMARARATHKHAPLPTVRSASPLILLQKSLWGDGRKFSEPLMRFTRREVREPYRFIQNRSRVSAVKLKGDAGAEKSKD